jgi:hypothetical protein
VLQTHLLCCRLLLRNRDARLRVACLKRFLGEFSFIKRELYELSGKTVRALLKAIKYYS